RMILYYLSSFNNLSFLFFFFNDTATTEIYTTRHTLSLHDALPISTLCGASCCPTPTRPAPSACSPSASSRSEEHTSELQSRLVISYAVFCLKKKKQKKNNKQSTNKNKKKK